jgi:hypothetical protein
MIVLSIYRSSILWEYSYIGGILILYINNKLMKGDKHQRMREKKLEVTRKVELVNIRIYLT